MSRPTITEVSALIADLATLRQSCTSADHAALMERKAELLERIAAHAPGDADAADRVAAGLAAAIWDDRDGFVYEAEPLAASLDRAVALARGADRPVLLLDHGDNCMSGGTCDSMSVLHEALAQGLSGIAVGPVCDPEAVTTLIGAGVGAVGGAVLTDGSTLGTLGGAALGGIIGHQTSR